ncbi:TetR/AcrR family transcriptional regulator [Cytobacillus sp. FSL W7-1323]|uniref:TetR/AcrR family transcriptional regulator n=1 Tax=Cytobacillus TaxID=2675230 RepID=UPI001CD62200|nr:TetR/AcrR family transcriptional regulator [Cytobacillus kochii]MCA1026573.1 TetR/AcrR family transcriptional regulator [Cytobacillus kochii]MCM3322276.1 TetR/AcrR family transcriptional regulator [Cytobacillus kochii]MCM3345245.1 TetR/AcrR family transcriptional regulator [Cytobacillus kochii]MDM5209799.1 TetR/AcrR family transcriptional regulator [Cytobacillus kochii]MDQ0187824.1 AcrR family transcriptional regulator [Cytobacillus kochii]
MPRFNDAQLESIREERKEQIMKAAMKVFAENGIKLTKISMIAKEAGISHGLVYHYFQSKEEVLFESLEWSVALGESQAFLEKLKQEERTPVQKIHKFTTFALTSGSNHVFRVIQHLEHSENVPQHILAVYKNIGQMYIEFFLPIFIEGQQLGEIMAGDPEELVGLFLTVISGIMADDPDWWKDNIDEKVSILLRMITSR